MNILLVILMLVYPLGFLLALCGVGKDYFEDEGRSQLSQTSREIIEDTTILTF